MTKFRVGYNVNQKRFTPSSQSNNPGIAVRMSRGLVGISEVTAGTNIPVLAEILKYEPGFRRFNKELGVELFNVTDAGTELMKTFHEILEYKKKNHFAFNAAIHVNDEFVQMICAHHSSSDLIAEKFLDKFKAHGIKKVILSIKHDMAYSEHGIFHFVSELRAQNIDTQILHKADTEQRMIQTSEIYESHHQAECPYGILHFPGNFNTEKEKWAESINNIKTNGNFPRFASHHFCGNIGADNVGAALEMMASGLPANMPLGIQARNCLLVGGKLDLSKLYAYLKNIDTWLTEAIKTENKYKRK
jgi:hypothetical protein